MQKKILIFSRFVFVGIFVLFTGIFLCWELMTLFNFGRKITIKSTKVEAGFENQLIRAEAREENETMVKSDIGMADARPEIIRRYLEKYKSPLLPYSDLIFQLSERYGYEYYWIVAIAQQESNLCKKIPEGSFNCWGYGIHSKGTLRFDSYELALTSFAEYLKREYFDKGRNTTELIMKKYCPSSNGSWAFGVNQFIGEMESGSF